MNDLIDRLGLHELPVLELLEEVLWQEIRSQNEGTEEEIQRIVLIFGRVLKAAIELAKENKNGPHLSNE